MNTFTLEIWDDECSRCTFYTVRKPGAKQNETDRFLLKYGDQDAYKSSIQDMVTLLLKSIGEDHGADKALFNRDENEVQGLPPHGRFELESIGYHFPDFPLRLYALRLRVNLVVLFNGGIKDGPTNQTSSLNMNWREACAFARRIDDALMEGALLIDEERSLLFDPDQPDELIL
ncbi:hypothetical protein [Pontibacter sp. G13]|uniref:hypothetical protein n=1 Tax=Pontibacter sp. G13 TaxID=3074898 RepID=UPI00288A8A83|nr:hypothetical protein [Pontibacter sp. G13]WNJ16587.1 hypothetical protein RJD25_17115 [Pontibacter sp. G13]